MSSRKTRAQEVAQINTDKSTTLTSISKDPTSQLEVKKWSALNSKHEKGSRSESSVIGTPPTAATSATVTPTKGSLININNSNCSIRNNSNQSIPYFQLNGNSQTTTPQQNKIPNEGKHDSKNDIQRENKDQQVFQQSEDKSNDSKEETKQGTRIQQINKISLPEFVLEESEQQQSENNLKTSDQISKQNQKQQQQQQVQQIPKKRPVGRPPKNKPVESQTSSSQVQPSPSNQPSEVDLSEQSNNINNKNQQQQTQKNKRPYRRREKQSEETEQHSEVANSTNQKNPSRSKGTFNSQETKNDHQSRKVVHNEPQLQKKIKSQPINSSDNDNNNKNNTDFSEPKQDKYKDEIPSQKPNVALITNISGMNENFSQGSQLHTLNAQHSNRLPFEQRKGKLNQFLPVFNQPIESSLQGLDQYNKSGSTHRRDGSNNQLNLRREYKSDEEDQFERDAIFEEERESLDNKTNIEEENEEDYDDIDGNNPKNSVNSFIRTLKEVQKMGEQYLMIGKGIKQIVDQMKDDFFKSKYPTTTSRSSSNNSNPGINLRQNFPLNSQLNLAKNLMTSLSSTNWEQSPLEREQSPINRLNESIHSTIDQAQMHHQRRNSPSVQQQQHQNSIRQQAMPFRHQKRNPVLPPQFLQMQPSS